MPKNKFRASYSVLSKWASGDYEMAVKMYFKLETFTSKAMAEGKFYHKTWEKHINETKTMPKVFGGAKLRDPKTEGKKVVQIADWLELVGVIDLVDVDEFFDWKTGKTSSESYINSKQIPVYAYLLKLLGKPMKKATVWRYDQHRKKADVSFRWITNDTIKEGEEWVNTYASEMHTYLTDNKLYERFGKK
jgi:hypothetical protein